MIAAALLAVALQVPSPQTPPPPASPVPFRMPPIVLSEPGAGGVRVAGGGVFGNFHPASGRPRAPGVLLLGGSEGGLGLGTAREAQALARHGFAVLQLAYFGAPGTPPALAGVPLETFDRAIAWLASRPEVDGRRLAVVGASKGAEAALLTAAGHPELKAVVAVAPSAVVWPGIDFSRREMSASWTRDGQELPFIRYGTPPAGTPGLTYIFTGYRLGFESLPQHPDAAIPVGRIRAPVLLICGEADTLWPSCPMGREVQARLARERPSTPVRLLAYPDAGHLVTGAPPEPDAPPPAPASLTGLGGTPEGVAEARRRSWTELLAFLDATLAR